MKTCHRARKKLSAYQDGEVSQPQSNNIKSHLQNCDSCRKYLADLRQAGQLINCLPEIKPDSMFTGRVMDSVIDTSLCNCLSGNFFRLLPIPSAAISMIIIGLLAGSLLGNVLIGKNHFPDSSSPGYSGREITLASLMVFDAVPEGSIADGYFNMTSANMEH